MSNDLPPSDQALGAPHPRETLHLFGQSAPEAEFLSAFNAGRLHHGWLLHGPRGIGKATLAWRIGQFLLATPDNEDEGMLAPPPTPETLDIDANHPVSRRLQAGADPGLASIIRTVNEKTGRMRNEIVVDDIRRLNRFFGLSATDGGRRVVIVDSADEMNSNAANALLKMLEEPPARTTLLLISHQPSRLLPTIRSRCRNLRLAPLQPDDMIRALRATGFETPNQPDHLAALAVGSVGDALRLINLGGLELYTELMAILASLPQLNRPRALALADAAAQRNANERFELLLNLIDIAMARLAQTGARGTPPLPEATQGEAQVLTRLAPSPESARKWATVAAEITQRSRQGKAVNLDPASLVLDTVFRMQDVSVGR